MNSLQKEDDYVHSTRSPKATFKAVEITIDNNVDVKKSDISKVHIEDCVKISREISDNEKHVEYRRVQTVHITPELEISSQ